MCACSAPRSRVSDSPAYAALPATQRPYNVFGVWYYPLSSAHGFVEQGRASWYGPGFHGKQTSNGESYDMNALTAAHKTLPLGTFVEVTRIDTGKSVVVRLNDRGPFVDDRIIDLSRTAAQRLGMITSGTAPVRIVALPGRAEDQKNGDSSEGLPGTDASVAGDFTVFVGEYAMRQEADAVKERLVREGFKGRVLQITLPDGVRYRVCAGAFNDLIEAHINAAALREAVSADARVVNSEHH